MKRIQSRFSFFVYKCRTQVQVSLVLFWGGTEPDTELDVWVWFTSIQPWGCGASEICILKREALKERAFKKAPLRPDSPRAPKASSAAPWKCSRTRTIPVFDERILLCWGMFRWYNFCVRPIWWLEAGVRSIQTVYVADEADVGLLGDRRVER